MVEEEGPVQVEGRAREVPERAADQGTLVVGEAVIGVHRDRPVEIEPLARALISQICRKSGRSEPDLTQPAIEMLRRYSWPGNIRELRNVMERAVLLCGRGPITLEHLPVEKMGTTLPARRGSLPPPPLPAPRNAPPGAPPPKSRPPMHNLPPEFEQTLPVARPTAPPGGDNALKSRLNVYYTVTVTDDSSAARSDDVIVIAPSVDAATLNNKYKCTSKGVVVVNTAQMGPSYMAIASATGTISGTGIYIKDATQQVSASLAVGTRAMYSTTGTIAWGTPIAGSITAATTTSA